MDYSEQVCSVLIQFKNNVSLAKVVNDKHILFRYEAEDNRVAEQLRLSQVLFSSESVSSLINDFAQHQVSFKSKAERDEEESLAETRLGQD